MLILLIAKNLFLYLGTEKKLSKNNVIKKVNKVILICKL